MLKQTSPNELAALTLLDAQALVESGWLQGRFARNAGGAVVDPRDDCAASFCMIGAVCKVTGRDYGDEWGDWPELVPLIAVTGSLIADGLSGWNDAKGRTQAEVVAAFGKAAELVNAQ